MKKQKLRYSRHIKAMYVRLPKSALSAVSSLIFSGLGSDLGWECLRDFSSGRHDSLLGRKLNPSSYNDPFVFRDDYLAVSLLSKYPYLDTKVDREKVALETFRLTEQQCSETNSRLSASYVPGITSQYTPESILFMAQVKIANLLGPFDWDLAEPHFGFGPGSTSSLPRRRGDAFYKFGALKPQVTKACSVLGLCAVSRIPRWYDHLAGLSGKDPQVLRGNSIEEQINTIFELTDGNRVTTVPKSAKTDRVIAIEPDLNMFIQKGIGTLLRNHLKRVGIDLNNQIPNQKGALEGSKWNKLATIDLSSASDTVSLRLVECLLPEDWVSAIKQCRSPVGTLPSGEKVTYQKVSSMGNGFTFELESLIFWALCSSVISLFQPDERQLLVFGDDIILSSSIYHTVSWILKYCGFTVNPSKSFSDGPFRESCGKHYFQGVDVTPFYVRDRIESPDRMIWFANQIRRWSRLPVYGLDGRMYHAYTLAVSYLPDILRQPTVPDLFGDVALFGDFDECKPKWNTTLQCLEGIGLCDVKRSLNPGEYPHLLRQLLFLEKSRSDNVSGVSFEVVSPNFERRWKIEERSSVSFKVVSPSLKRNWTVIRLPTTRWESYGDWLLP